MPFHGRVSAADARRRGIAEDRRKLFEQAANSGISEASVEHAYAKRFDGARRHTRI
jgi:hypothetical protein